MWPHGPNWTYIELRAHVFFLRSAILYTQARWQRRETPLHEECNFGNFALKIVVQERIFGWFWCSITGKQSQMVMPCGALWYITFGFRKQSMYNCLIARRLKGLRRKRRLRWQFCCPCCNPQLQNPTQKISSTADISLVIYQSKSIVLSYACQTIVLVPYINNHTSINTHPDTCTHTDIYIYIYEYYI